MQRQHLHRTLKTFTECLSTSTVRCQAPLLSRLSSNNSRHLASRRKERYRFRARYIVFPELEHAPSWPGAARPTQPRAPPAYNPLLAAIAELRRPTLTLPIRYFLAPEIRPGPPSAGPDRGRDAPPAVAVPDLRALASLPKAKLAALVASSVSLRALAALLHNVSNQLRCPEVLAAALHRVAYLVDETHLSTFAVYPGNLAATRHVSEVARCAGQAVPGEDTAKATWSSRATLARQLIDALLLPRLAQDDVVQTMTGTQLVTAASALHTLQVPPDHSACQQVWERLDTKDWFDGADASDMLRLCYAATTGPCTTSARADLAARCLVKLQASSAVPSVPLSSSISAADAVCGWAALHALHRLLKQADGSTALPRDVQKAHSQSARLERSASPHSAGSESEAHLRAEGVPAATASAPASEDTRAFESAWRASSGHAALGAELARRMVAGARDGTLSWHDHGPLLLRASRDAPTAPQQDADQLSDRHALAQQRRHQRYLTPLADAALHCFLDAYASRTAPGVKPMRTGEALAVLDLMSQARIAARRRPGAQALAGEEAAVAEATGPADAKRVVDATCPELQAQVGALSAHEAASSVVLLGDILGVQGGANRLQSDAAYDYLRALFASNRLQDLSFTAPQAVMLTCGVRALFGAGTRAWWCAAWEAHAARVTPSTTTQQATGFGRPMHIPGLLLGVWAVTDGVTKELVSRPVDAGSAQLSIHGLDTLAAMRMPYKMVVPFLRASTSHLLRHLQEVGGEHVSTRDLAQCLRALGDLGLNFKKVYPLVFAMVEVLEDRVDSFDVTDCYLIADGLSKLGARKSDVTPLLTAAMAHLAEGLAIRPTKPALLANILSTPPSQLIKFATAIHDMQLFRMRQFGYKDRYSPQATFSRVLVSHFARSQYADLTHRDLIRLLRMMKGTGLAAIAPSAWVQDLSLRTVERFAARLFGDTPRLVPDTDFWQGQPIQDVTYTGVAHAPLPEFARDRPETEGAKLLYGRLAFPGIEEGVFVDAVGGAADDAHPHSSGTAQQRAPIQAGDLSGGDAGTYNMSEIAGGGDAVPESAGRTQGVVAYRRAYSVLEHANKLVLVALQARDFATGLLRVVDTFTHEARVQAALAGAGSLRGSEDTPHGATSLETWRTIHYTQQDQILDDPEDVDADSIDPAMKHDDIFDSEPAQEQELTKRERRRQEARQRQLEVRLRKLSRYEKERVPNLPDADEMDLSASSTNVRARRPFLPHDAAQLAGAIADMYPNSAVAGKDLCAGVVVRLFNTYPMDQHNVSDVCRLVWAVGAISGDDTLPLVAEQLIAALERAEGHIDAIQPKFAMLLLKGLNRLALKGDSYAANTSDPEYSIAKDAFGRAPDLDNSTARALQNRVLGVTQTATQHIASVLQADIEVNKPFQSLAVVGVGEAARGAAFLLHPSHSPYLSALVVQASKGLQSLKQRELARVPARATSGLLTASAALLSQRKASVSDRTLAMFQRTALERLLSNRRSTTPFQLRALVQSLRWLANYRAPSDVPLLKALLWRLASRQVVVNAKRRGRPGAERLVRAFEMLAELSDLGVMWSGDFAASTAQSRGARTVVHVDESLREHVTALMIDVAQAQARDMVLPNADVPGGLHEATDRSKLEAQLALDASTGDDAGEQEAEQVKLRSDEWQPHVWLPEGPGGDLVDRLHQAVVTLNCEQLTVPAAADGAAMSLGGGLNIPAPEEQEDDDFYGDEYDEP